LSRRHAIGLGSARSFRGRLSRSRLEELDTGFTEDELPALDAQVAHESRAVLVRPEPAGRLGIQASFDAKASHVEDELRVVRVDSGQTAGREGDRGFDAANGDGLDPGVVPGTEQRTSASIGRSEPNHRANASAQAAQRSSWRSRSRPRSCAAAVIESTTTGVIPGRLQKSHVVVTVLMVRLLSTPE
jgi:hypothetical protein